MLTTTSKSDINSKLLNTFHTISNNLLVHHTLGWYLA